MRRRTAWRLGGGGANTPRFARRGVVAEVRPQLLQPAETGGDVRGRAHHGRVVRVPRLQHVGEFAPEDVRQRAHGDAEEGHRE